MPPPFMMYVPGLNVTCAPPLMARPPQYTPGLSDVVMPETLTWEVWSQPDHVGAGMSASGSANEDAPVVTAGLMLVFEPVSLPTTSITPGLALREAPPVTCRALLLLEST